MSVATRRIVACLVASVSLSSWAAEITASTAQQIRDAITSASHTPGTVIHITAGHYAFTSAMWTGVAGSAAMPIRITGDGAATTQLDFDSAEGIVINHAHWVLEKVWLNGVCPGGCDGSAGLHLKATADHFTGQKMKITNFGQNIKGDRTPDLEVSDSSILDSEFSNTAPALTAGGTAIDLVGGKRWRIAGNYVHDYARDETHYGIFIKGGSSDSVIERNLVIGAKDLAHGSGAEVGISFGGGGTGPQFCALTNKGASFCTCEDFNGVARNNIVINVNDSALHTKVACGSQFLNNTVIGSSPGLQIQIASTGAAVEAHNNVFSGGISGGTHIATDNLLNVTSPQLAMIYANAAGFDLSAGSAPAAIKDKGPNLAKVTDDYFGSPRTGLNDWGAVEFPSSGVVWPWPTGSSATTDGGVSPSIDSGTPSIDAGATKSDGGVSGPSDAGSTGVDAGVDGGVDGGVGSENPPKLPCSCSGSAVETSLGAALLALWHRSRRKKA